jgi:hypothetical protein
LSAVCGGGIHAVISSTRQEAEHLQPLLIGAADAGEENLLKWTRSRHLVFAKIAAMIEMAGLQIGPWHRNFEKCCLGQDFGGNVFDRGIGDFVNEADVLVFAGHDAGDDFPPGDLGIDNGLAPAPPIIDHHDEILHGGALFGPESKRADAAIISENRNYVN